jgi:uncharacterized protein
MKSKLLHELEGLRTFAVVMDKGDDAASELSRFARAEGVTGASLTAVGGCREATLGYFDPASMSYRDIPVSTQAEILSLVGDIALGGDEPVVHAHAVLGLRDGSTDRWASTPRPRVADAGSHRDRVARTPAQTRRFGDRSGADRPGRVELNPLRPAELA